MSSSNEEIGSRVRESLGVLTQTALAEQIGMTFDAMSRAIRGHRGFSSVELADVASVLDVDVYWLITGQEDPMRVQIAARHNFSQEAGKHSNEGRSTDQQDLDAVALAYRQAYPETVTPSALPSTPDEMREALGPDFVRDFADRVEVRLGIDIIRLPRLSTAYSFTLGGRRAILLPSHSDWFRSNSNLAHELGHFALGHHNAGSEDPRNEPPANTFATGLLMPERVMRSQRWAAMPGADAARFLWNIGLSGMYVRNRLSDLGIQVSAEARSVLAGRMPGSLRPYLHELGVPLTRDIGPFVTPIDPITERMTAAAQRRFPPALIAAHEEAIERGCVNPATLAWMLDSTISDEADGPTVPEIAADDLSAFGF